MDFDVLGRFLSYDPDMKNAKYPLVPWFLFGLLISFWGFGLMTHPDEGEPTLGWLAIVVGLSGVLVAVIAKGIEYGVAATQRASKPDSYQ